jgi:hypothetical protein
MTLAPIRGAPPGANVPAFPVEEPKAKQAQPTAATASGDQVRPSPMRQPHMPIAIGGSGITLTFTVMPEQPAISRPSMTIDGVADPKGSSSSDMVGFLRMSAVTARAFLADLRGRLSAGAYYLSCGVEGQAFRHAVGWAYLDSEHLFFDPNIGEYKVLNHEKFGIEYFKQCEAACRIRYTDAIFFRFYLRP